MFSLSLEQTAKCNAQGDEKNQHISLLLGVANSREISKIYSRKFFGAFPGIPGKNIYTDELH